MIRLSRIINFIFFFVNYLIFIVGFLVIFYVIVNKYIYVYLYLIFDNRYYIFYVWSKIYERLF